VAELRRTPGRHVTRRLEDPSAVIVGSYVRSQPGNLAHLLAATHNSVERAGQVAR